MTKSIVIIFGGFISEIEVVNAAAVGRVFDLAKIIYGAGYKPIILGLSNKSDEISQNNYFDCYLIEKKKNTGGVIEKFKGISDFNRKMRRKLNHIFTENDVRGMFYHNAFARFIIPSYRVAMKKRIPLGVIADDWYEYQGKLATFLDSEVAWKVIYPHFRNFIVTSRYFERYFSKKGNNIIRVPAIFDCKKAAMVNHKGNVESEIQIAYAGNMQNLKDRTDLVIKAMWLLKKNSECNVVLHLFGNTQKQIRELMKSDEYVLEELKDNIRFYGFVYRDELWERMQNIDFTILIRPHMRYAEAGFATKFAESFVHGIPVIANLTSDIELYLRDGENGLIVQSDDIGKIADALRRAMNLAYEERVEMRKKAFETGIEHFNLENYTDKMQHFMKDIII